MHIKIIAVMLLAGSVEGKEITMGETFKILEPNPIIQIQEKLTTDKQKIQTKVQEYQKKSIKKLTNLENNFKIDLPEAGKDNVWIIDTRFKLKIDIPDGKGGILYPKGYQFDPKDYLRLSKNIVVLDGTNEKQIKWAAEKTLFNNRNFKILITKGPIVKIMQKIKAPIYFYTKEVHQRLKLKHTPTIVKQEPSNNNYLYAYEFNIK